MKDLALGVLKELGLDYRITLVSGGESGNYEIVMWDRPRNSYFSIRFKWFHGMDDTVVSRLIRTELCERIAAHRLADDRRPARRWSAARAPA